VNNILAAEMHHGRIKVRPGAGRETDLSHAGNRVSHGEKPEDRGKFFFSM
jgi:hypothetical protein